MSVRKLSVSIPAELADAVAAAAARDGAGLSAWLTQAAAMRLANERALDDGYRAVRELIAEYQDRHGSEAITAARTWSDAVLTETGAGSPGSPGSRGGSL